MATLKYNEKFPAIAEDLAANGESDERIAFRLQISMPTFYNYKAQFPEFAEALVVGRKVCYSRVRAKLLKLAQGRCTVITEVYQDGELHKTIERQLPPNLKAITYFQKHMRTGGRLSDLSCWPHGRKTENQNTLPQTDSKMSNGEESRADQLAVRLVPQSGDPTAPAVPENTLPQTDSKMLAVRLVPQSGDPTAPAALENTLPQTDSKDNMRGDLPPVVYNIWSA
jgi:hypothetical protein